MIAHAHTACPRRAGTALLVVVLYLGVLTLLGSAFIGAVHHGLGRVYANEQAAICSALADAGVEKALAELRAKPNGFTGEEAVLGDGGYSVTIEARAADRLRVVSTGFLRFDGVTVARRVVTVDVTLEGGRIAGRHWTESSR